MSMNVILQILFPPLSVAVTSPPVLVAAGSLALAALIVATGSLAERMARGRAAPTAESAGGAVRRLGVRRETAIRRLDAVRESVIAAVRPLSEAEWRRKDPAARISPGALAQHVVEEFDWLNDVLQQVPVAGATTPPYGAAWRTPPAGHLTLVVRDIFDRQRPAPAVPPLMDVVEATVTHLERHARSLEAFALQDAPTHE